MMMNMVLKHGNMLALEHQCNVDQAFLPSMISIMMVMMIITVMVMMILIMVLFLQIYMLFLKFIVNVFVDASVFLFSSSFPVYFLETVSFCHSRKWRPVVFSHWECFLHNIARVEKIDWHKNCQYLGKVKVGLKISLYEIIDSLPLK